MLKSADLLIDPYRPGVLSKLGLPAQTLSQLNPRLCVLRISGFGQSSQ
jgi:crotonobetainyl-CoA:carnitine CoA-transferase CaiB-like acyl-CoA transferase